MTVPDFSRSTQTLALIEILQSASIGSVISYAKLSDTIGEDIQTDARHYLYSAIRAVQADGLAFGTVRGEGIKRLTAEEIPAIGDAALLHIRRSSKRARKKMRVADGMNDMSNEARVKINATASLLGAIEHFSTGRAASKAAEATTHGPLPPMKLLDALK
jgi:hypothetical protein